MFKDVLRHLREEKGLTQEQLAQILGVQAGTIGNYEQGQRLPKDDKMWISIAQYFNVSVDYLMDVPPNPHIIAASTITIDGEPVVLHSYGNKKKDKLLKDIAENDIPDNILDLMSAAIAPYKK